MRYAKLMLAIIFAAPLSPLTTAADADYRQLGAHLHGSAELNLVVEGETLVVELITPAANLLGFEHKAESVADRRKLEQALEVLEAARWLRLTSGAGCELQSTEIESPLLEDPSGEHHGDQAKEEHHDHHGDHAKDNHHDQHAGAHAHGQGDQEAHSEFHIAYRYRCRTPEALTGAEVALWQWFEGFERIRGQLIAPQGQQRLELTRDAPRIRF